MITRLKDRLPKSLYGRAMLIIVLPIAMMQVAVAWAFFDKHWETVTSRLAAGVAGDIAVVLDLYHQDPTPARLATIDPFMRRTLAISVALEPEARLPTSVRPSFFHVVDRTLRRALADTLQDDFWFDTTRYSAYVDIRVQVEEGVLRFVVPRDRVFATTGHIFLLWIVGATTLLTAVSLIYIRNQAKPLERLADAAERFGRGQDAPDFKPAGASEVRKAAQAFIDMRRRIQRHIEQRTTVLAGVSHDLRTPLTRLKLQLAMMVDTEEAASIRRDLDDMETVLEEYLAFARGMGGEDADRVDLTAMIGEIVEQAASDGTNVTVSTEDDLVAEVRAGSIKRCIENLVGNAAAHGKHVMVNAGRNQEAVLISVDDDGPGIPEAAREEAFKPFNRLDAARNRNRKGVGLGLAIARDVARGHGGDVTLSDSPLGGLRATVRLPAAAEISEHPYEDA